MSEAQIEFGLSPRVRGNPVATAAQWALNGSIPACAGEPSPPHASASQSAVYPRVCGGTRYLGTPSGIVDGLSPRVRGNPGRRRDCTHDAGSIPACAGEPGGFCFRFTPRWVYPRVCGGTAVADEPLATARGLSPRVRGNRHQRISAFQSVRSIPACAGEPTGIRGAKSITEVYPRVCGGTGQEGGYRMTDEGLSPRVRGNLLLGFPNAVPKRSIPACAGEPPPLRPARFRTSVYPRVCGGTRPAGPQCV